MPGYPESTLSRSRLPISRSESISSIQDGPMYLLNASTSMLYLCASELHRP